jgi:hypothetical protein|uniref:Helicase ATP-binding domain-containing protein n=1 Tax=viral metagenome TaxID=1070528 RepID=A0A6C0JBS5_9ZZZZ
MLEELERSGKPKPISKRSYKVIFHKPKDIDPGFHEVTTEELLNKPVVGTHQRLVDKRKDMGNQDYGYLRQLAVMPHTKDFADDTQIARKQGEKKLRVLSNTPIPIKVKLKRKTKRINVKEKSKNEVATVSLNEELVVKMHNKEDVVIMKRSSYYMNNRQIFIQFINQLFNDYKKDIKTSSETFTCDKLDASEEFRLLTHQKIVRDYINLYTPYRGLLLYHGLGSGKTCSSIAIAEGFLSVPSIAITEGLVSPRKVIIMTPASLRTNFFEELKKCGNPLFKKNQFWEFVELKEGSDDMAHQLSTALHLPISMIKKNRGAWFVNVKNESNYDSLSSNDKDSLEQQIEEMIHQKYMFINYNGLRKQRLAELTHNSTVNPFDHKVVIIDEAHNFVSRIVNKIEKDRKSSEPKFLPTQLYNLLLDATDVRIIFLTGTPIINYPNEIAILFNMLRGRIKSWHLPFEQKKVRGHVNTEYIRSIFEKHDIVDYLEVNTNEIIITKNPYEFTNKFYGDKYKGVRKSDKLQFISDDDFIKEIIEILHKNNVPIAKDKIKIDFSKALPDNRDEFNSMFIEGAGLKNEGIFKRRILGLTSYFRSAQESLMPKYEPKEDLHIVKIEMSDYQLQKYQEVRLQERKLEKRGNTKKKKKSDALYEDSTSSYRIFSRAFCNFVFPNSVGRPMPNEGSIDEAVANIKDEDDIDGISRNERLDNIDGRIIEDDDIEVNESYTTRISHAIAHLDANKTTLLSRDSLETHSPKFLHLLENIDDDSLIGSHLIYSQFRTLEGIGIFSLVLEANGYYPLKLKRTGQEWSLDMPDASRKKGKIFALYTGTETVEEKEIIRNIFNGNFKGLSQTLVNDLNEIHSDNKRGELIKIFMITSSGAEGISLKNCRYVHIMEPYWHPVRAQQVIGRARRICSHNELPELERNIKVFVYLMKFSAAQIKTKLSIELLNNETSRFSSESKVPLTSDESLYEIMNMKETITQSILKAVKEAAMDCGVHVKANMKESLECFSFGNEMNPNVFSYTPNISQEDRDAHIEKLNKKDIKWRAVKKTIDGKEYALRLDSKGDSTNMLYDIETFMLAKTNKTIDVVYIGKIVTDSNGIQYIDGNM